MPTVLLVTHDTDVRSALHTVASELCWDLVYVTSAEDVWAERPVENTIELVVIDRRHIDSQVILGELRSSFPDSEIVLFAQQSASSMVSELRAMGVSTYFSFPSTDTPHLTHLLLGAMDKARLRHEHRSLKERLHHRSFHDSLTGLPNGALLRERLQAAVSQRANNPGALFAVLFLDIDRFKNINDSLGHHEGDQLILAIAQRLQAHVRPHDLVARLGGDEFTILLTDVRSRQEAIDTAERVQRALMVPFKLDSQEIFVTASIGIAIGGDAELDPQHLLRDADTAMYRAKSRGSGFVEVFDACMHTQAVELLGLETNLRQALGRNELLVHYQPIVALDTGHIAGFEALLRWYSPERGIISPKDFIPMAEETGLIIPIGQWVLKEACAQLVSWRNALAMDAPLSMSVNISARQFSQTDLVDQIAQILEETKLDPHCLKLEITESLLIDNVESTVVMLHKLQNMNVRLCIDDFGTGYSSLSQLYQLPIHTLKVDRAFVNGLTAGSSHGEIVDTIIMLAHNLGMDVIAEGIETQEQFDGRDALRQRGCEYGQGYYFSRPMTAQAAAALMETLPPWMRQQAVRLVP